jgi:hypothetical protein
MPKSNEPPRSTPVAPQTDLLACFDLRQVERGRPAPFLYTAASNKVGGHLSREPRSPPLEHGRPDPVSTVASVEGTATNGT